MALMRPKVAIMRRIPKALAAKIGTILGLFTLNGPLLEAQDDLGVLVRPPAEIGTVPEDHPAPPAPTLPTISPRSASSEVPGPALAIGPPSGIPARRSVSNLNPADRPAIGGPGLSVRPPIGIAPPEDVRSQGVPTVSDSTTIGPPILFEGDRDALHNPLLPPGPESRDRAPRPDSDRGVDARSVRDVRTEERRRSGPIRGLLDRLSGRPSSPDFSTSVPRSGRPDDVIEPEDPAALEDLRRGIEREIIARESERISSIEVLIVGKRVHLRAEAARPWQRRALRRGLETLPMPEGYRASVDVR